MKRALQIFDDFHPDPYALRKAVVASEFKTIIGPDGKEYTGISQHPAPELFDLVADAVGHPIKVQMSGWRLNLQGEMPHNFAHADIMCAEHAGILYLNTPDQCQGGTAFWTHSKLGIHRMPTDDELISARVDPEAFKRQMEIDWCDPECWNFGGQAGMVFNRFITYPTSYFHGRVPLEAFGKDVNDGRIIWVVFYSSIQSP